LSRSIEEAESEVALRLNPLNAQARVNALTTALSDNDPDLQKLLRMANTGLATSPVDSRFHSLLGELRLRMGEEEEADRLFRQAHRLSRTEINALQHLTVRAIDTGDYAGAVENLDILLRRWPKRAGAWTLQLPRLLSDQGAYAAIVELMRGGAPWRGRIVSSLARQEEGLGIAYRLLLELADSDHPPERSEVEAVSRGFIAAKRYEEAYRLFRFTLPPGEHELAGFVYNASFLPASATSPFSWQYRNTRAAEISLTDETPFAGATVRFLNAPARDIVLRQTLLLSPGRYRLTAKVDASNLRAPRSLFWRVGCLDPRRELLRLTVPEGSYREQNLEASFVVDGCALQQIGLATGVISESWQNRYSGQVRFQSLRIEKEDLAEAER
jgi:tetratricopeptide (TPR) repeat protein